MVDIFDDDTDYVCTSHMMMVPCPVGDYHLVSNWASDVKRVKDSIEKNNK